MLMIAPTVPVQDMYTTAEAAEYLGLSVSAVKKHIYVIGDLAPDRTAGRTLLFSRATLDRFKRDGRLGRGRHKPSRE